MAIFLLRQFIRVKQQISSPINANEYGMVFLADSEKWYFQGIKTVMQLLPYTGLVKYTI